MSKTRRPGRRGPSKPALNGELFKIEKDTLPQETRGGANKKYPFEAMKLNESFVIPAADDIEERKSIRNNVLAASRRMWPDGMKFSTSIMDEEGVRVWRIK